MTDDDLDAAGHRTLEADENLNAQGHGQYGVEHTITLSLTRHRGLFDTVYGTVRNLRLQGNVSSSEATSVPSRARWATAHGWSTA